MRVFRILRAGAAILSLVLCLTIAGLWVRSRRVTDSLTLRPFPVKVQVATSAGQLLLIRDRPLLDPEEMRQWVAPTPHQHSFLGFGVEQQAKQRTWLSESQRKITYTSIVRTYYCPLWFCEALFLILPLIELRKRLRKFRRRRDGLCSHCGYDLRASLDRCPECGRSRNNPIAAG